MFNALLNLLSPEAAPTKVLDVKLDSYTSRDVCYREDGMILYAPPEQNKNDKSNFEILLHRPYTETLNLAYSLFRSEDKCAVETRFLNFKGKVSPFVEINKEICNTTGIQRLCDAISEHPSWSLAHLATHFALVNSFDHPTIAACLDSEDSATGMTPLQLAITTSNLKIVQTLVAKNCSLEHLDHNGNSVFHYGAKTNRDIITALTKGSLCCLNTRNSNGYTPLHVACLADRPDCVKALLLAGADVNVAATRAPSPDRTTPGYVADFLLDNPNKLCQQDMRFGGTPLHWSCSREVIETLLQKNCDIDATNFDERTALHVMVLRNRLECVVALLSHRADPNVGDFEGSRPLHLAVKQGNLAVVQSLLVFGADVDALNNHGWSARHVMTADQEPRLLYALHAVGASRCAANVAGCTAGCSASGDFDGIPPAPVVGPANRRPLNEMLAVAGMDNLARRQQPPPLEGRLLCLDGGGIRGLVLVQLLAELEAVAARPIVSCFDWIAGTSTGGILALALASGKTLRECLCLYFRMKEHTFVGSRPYPSEPLENILKETFGETTVMTDIVRPKLLIPGVLADRKPVELHLFRNYDSPSELLAVPHDGPYELPPPPRETLLWHVGRATGAAPSYFRAFGRFLDGGLMANNPTLDALTEINEYNLARRARGEPSEMHPVRVVVSVGTGMIPVTELHSIDVYRPESVLDSVLDSAKIIKGLSALGTLIVDQATASDGRVVDRARAWCSMIGVPYYRFSPQMSEDISMDEKSDEKLVKMLWECKAYMHQNMQAMRELAVLLTAD